MLSSSFRNTNQSFRKISCSSTSNDSSSQGKIKHHIKKIAPEKVKTQLCKNFEQTGHCRYRKKCKFAHGPHQLVQVKVADCFRKKRCKGFWQEDFCSYGVRCQFAHQEKQWSLSPYMAAINSILQINHFSTNSKLLKILNL